MKIRKAVLLSIAICVAFVIVETLFANGTDIFVFFAELKQPAFSLPVWGWLIIGSAYYLMCLAILYNLLTSKASFHRNIAIMLVITMMIANATWNYLLFGLQNFYYSFIGLLGFIPVAFILFFLLWKFQKKSALILFPYLIWLVYDFFLIRDLWKINE